MPSVLLAALVVQRPAIAGDAEVAGLMLKAGRAALSKGDADTAIDKFRKALVEFPDLIESMYWLGAAFEKMGDKAEALTSYRDFVRLFGEKKTKGDVSKEEARLNGLAVKRVDVLGVGEREFKKLETGFIEKLFQYARDNFVRDPALSLKALEILLDIEPDNQAARRLYEKLGGKIEEPAVKNSGPQASTGPFKDVKKWIDLLEAKAFPEGGILAYGKTTMIDNAGGTIFWPAMAISVGSDFAFEIEARFVSEYERNWTLGLLIAATQGSGNKFVAAMIQKTQIEFIEETGADRVDMAEPYLIQPIEFGAWHRLGLLARGNHLEVWLDGKKIQEHTSNTRSDFKGTIGIFQQRSKVEIRVLKIGKLS